MNRTPGRRTLFAVLFAALITVAAPAARADKWTAPTPEELSMTSQPQVPGAAAVYLYREETTEDDMHEFSISVRLKVLTEGGKKYGDVELYYGSHGDGGGTTISDIEGRTIHPDGTIIPFTGKPYQKLIEKTRGDKVMSKVFSMPDVQVGSIIEYHYQVRYDDNVFYSPQWYIQSGLFTRKAHYVWKPTTKELRSERGEISTISWTPILPSGVEVKQTTTPATAMKGLQWRFEVNVDNVPPAPDEDFMPPISSFTYRVLFYYTMYRTPEDFWKSEAKRWAKDRDKFIGPGHHVTAAVQELIAPTDTQDQKLRKIYAAVMKLENTDFTRAHSSAEEKAQGLKEVHNTDDILDRKRGNNDQLTELFVAMARAAGMKAYIIDVPNRDRKIFLKSYLSFDQFDDYLAIVNVDGKEQYFDPGSRYCPYQHLAWKHTMATGIRQIDGSAEFAESPSEPYSTSHVQRIADLTMDPQGLVTGTIKMTYIGAPALAWRQQSLTGDAASLERDLRTTVERLIPQGMDVKVASIDKLDDYEQPLTVNLEVKGPIGSSTGKRLLIPGDIFEANAKPAFPHEKRDIPVYFEYPHMMQDAIRIKYPPNLKVESVPAADTFKFQSFALYTTSSVSNLNSITLRRNYTLGEVIFLPKEYSDLRSFYSKMENKDQESLILTTAPVAAKPASSGN